MSWRVYRQQDGLGFAVWSTISDSFVAIDCSTSEVLNLFLEDAAQLISRQLEGQMRRAEALPEARQRELAGLREECLKRLAENPETNGQKPEETPPCDSPT